jgi:hypothetical protein
MSSLYKVAPSMREMDDTMGKASHLREAVKALFYPFATSRGFIRAKSKNPLFIVFRREVGETMQVFELQWEKYGRPSFIVNFSEGPAAGVNVRGTHIAGWDLLPPYCAALGRLQLRKGLHLRCWFRLRKPLLIALASRSWFYEPEQVVEQLIALFPELEAWWTDKREGPHVHFSRRA